MESRSGYELAFTSAAPTPSRLGRYKTAAISSDGAQCSDAGRYNQFYSRIKLHFLHSPFFFLKLKFELDRDVLEEGGNAVDAAIAALFCNAVVNPQSAGIGGGFHMTVYDPVTRTAHCLDAREVAPLAATEDMFQSDPSLAKKGFFYYFSPIFFLNRGRND
jgi:gamma-glutamyltranspeptidase/glutathione hydrolase/leukotriene-C4 hydrolase